MRRGKSATLASHDRPHRTFPHDRWVCLQSFSPACEDREATHRNVHIPSRFNVPRRHALGTPPAMTTLKMQGPVPTCRRPPDSHHGNSHRCVMLATHVTRPGALTCPRGSRPMGLQATTPLVLRCFGRRALFLESGQKWLCTRDESAVFEDVFCLRDIALLFCALAARRRGNKNEP